VNVYRRSLPIVGERDVAAIIELFEDTSPPHQQ
jgi:hypothetical protein